MEILKEYSQNNPNITILEEANCGCEKSFEKLGQYAYKQCETDFYAYADQDDVWFPEKLSKSIAAITGVSKPALFCCNQMITDGDLNPMHLMIDEDHYERLCEVQHINYLKNRHGCVMVWNRQLMDVLGKAKHDGCYTPIHDRWLTLLGRISGVVIIGKEPLQYYRVHSGNVSGYAVGVVSRLKKGIKLYWLKDNQCSLYAADCLNSIEILPSNDDGLNYLSDVAAYKKSINKRIKIAFSRQIWYESFTDGLIHSVAVLLGKY